MTWICAVLGYTIVLNKTKKCTVKNSLMMTAFGIHSIQVQRLSKMQYNKKSELMESNSYMTY